VSKVDLHLHSTASDGRFTPAEVVRKAVEKGLTYIALTDHDNVDGIVPAMEAARAFPRLKIIPGVEISTDIPNGEVHMLGYFIDYDNSELKARLEKARNSRRERAQGMVTKLKNLGVFIEWDRVQEIAGVGTIARPHIAQAMLEKGYVSTPKEAFIKYIGRNGPAYVEREKMTPIEAVAVIQQARGLPVLAHPLTMDDPETVIIELKPAGLVGIEAYYDSYSVEQVGMLVTLARKYNLLTSGGSDYHGIPGAVETMMGDVQVPIEAAEQLVALAKQRHLKLE
jgi:predicted metal-dependent phosphoesterase TrpH